MLLLKPEQVVFRFNPSYVKSLGLGVRFGVQTLAVLTWRSSKVLGLELAKWAITPLLIAHGWLTTMLMVLWASMKCVFYGAMGSAALRTDEELEQIERERQAQIEAVARMTEELRARLLRAMNDSNPQD